MKLPLILILWLSLTHGKPSTSTPEWRKQLGTVTYPKSPELSPDVTKGSIYGIGERLFKAKIDGDYNAIMMHHGLPSQNSNGNQAWREIQRGTYMNPKTAADDDQVHTNEIIRDADGKLYMAMADGKLEGRAVNFQDGSVWKLVEDKAGWMGLLRDEIGDTRLGDIMTPGTHDTGTEGINDDSFLVDKNVLFRLALNFEPQILTNWSRTQGGSLGEQCRAGFRAFDMRIADMEEEDGSFRWWHGTTGYEIQRELQEVVDFLQEYPFEVLRMEFGHFAKPGIIGNPTRPIPDNRKDVIADILLEYLEPYLALQPELSDNPTINEVLATGKNIILEMTDSYIRAKHDGFWSSVSVSGWSGRTNPEDLFLERSSRLESYRVTAADKMNQLSGCNTPDETMIIPGLIRKYGDNETIRDIIEEVMPELLDVDPYRMSFEGMWTNLISFTSLGTNTAGMWVRPSVNYTSGASVHYRGVNEMARYWLARPQKYKLNELHVDDAVHSSTLVDTAILSARGEIPREVTIAFQGNAKDGYYRWDESGYQTEGGRDGLQCTTPSEARYRVTSATFSIDEEWQDLANKDVVTFQEGEYPGDAMVELQVSGSGSSEWFDIHNDNIQNMIENNLDLYLRGTNKEDGTGGFAYTSYTYNVFGEACDVPPESGFTELVEWN